MYSAEGKNESIFFKTKWQNLLSQLACEIDPPVYAAYIKPLKFYEYNKKESVLSLSAPSVLVSKHVNKYYGKQIKDSFKKFCGVSALNLNIAVPKKQPKENSQVFIKRDPVFSKKEVAQTGLNKRYSLKNFVVGPGNSLAYQASKKVAEKACFYNPLYIYSSVGLGKTHLLHAIGNQLKEKNKDIKVLCITSEDFTSRLISSMRDGSIASFKEKLRALDVFLVDDFQFTAKKQRTQEEFLHIFNFLFEEGKQLVVTADCPPQKLKETNDRLKNRFASGLTIDIDSPDLETRKKIIEQKSKELKFSLSKEVVSFVAENINKNVREIEGALTRLSATTLVRESDLSLDSCKESLRPFLKTERKDVTIKEIKKVITKFFDLNTGDIESKSRTKRVSLARQFAIYFARELTPCSCVEVGAAFSRDHSSIIHAYKVIQKKMLSSFEIKKQFQELEKVLLAS